jgi:molecular chaperone DnaK
VGSPAYGYLKQIPTNVVTSVKRLMGNSIHNENVQALIKNKSITKYGIISKTMGTEDTLAILLNGKEYLPEDISAEILKKVKTDSEERLQDTITHAVVTVPAYFSEKQKYATLVAAKLANIKVLKLLPEPSAAAIAYGADHPETNSAKTVLIYDFGGGTFDISILNMINGEYQEIAKGGDMWLGGDDIDKTLMNYIKAKTEKEYNILSLDDLIMKMSDEKKKYRAAYGLKEEAELVKMRLSSLQNTVFEFNDKIIDENGDLLQIEYTIERKEFENLIEPIVYRSIQLVKELIKKINYDNEMIDEFILVGGTSQIPFIQKKMRDEFGNRVKLSKTFMLEVAKGAAIVAQRMGQSDLTSDIVVGDIKKVFNDISHAIAHDIKLVVGEEDNIEEKLIFEAIQPYPAEKSIPVYTKYPNQKMVVFYIKYYTNNNKALDSGSLIYLPLKRDYPANKPINCTFFLDENEILHCTAQIEGEKENYKVVIDRGGARTKAISEINKTIEWINTQKITDHSILTKYEDFIATNIGQINNVDPDGTLNDKIFIQSAEDVSKLPNQINEELNLKPTGWDLDSLLVYVEFILDRYKPILKNTIEQDLIDIRSRIKQALSGELYEDPELLKKKIFSLVEKDNALQSLDYIFYAMIRTEDISIKNELNKYHDKAFDAACVNNYNEFNNIMSKAFPLANKVYELLGQPAKIRTALTFNNKS